MTKVAKKVTKKVAKKILLIDAGNSRLKWSSLEDSHLSAQIAITYAGASPIDCYSELLKTAQKDHDKIVLVSVLGKKFCDVARQLANELGFEFSPITSVKQLDELENAYQEPGKLGADRFVAMFAAYSQMMQEGKAKNNTIVIDCGTAVTIDAISANGKHLGGLILPGQDLCKNSLLKGTRQLDLSANENTKALLANNTSQAILSGGLYGISGAIQHICSSIEKQFFAEYKGKLFQVWKLN